MNPLVPVPPLPRQEPFPPPGKSGPTLKWAMRVLCIWADEGYPALFGVPAEQIAEVRRLLGAACP